MMDIGTADEANCNPACRSLTLQTKVDADQTRTLCDMGRGGNGVWADLAKFRVPPLRGLAARAPYFHDGQAKNIKRPSSSTSSASTSTSRTASARTSRRSWARCKPASLEFPRTPSLLPRERGRFFVWRGVR